MEPKRVIKCLFSALFYLVIYFVCQFAVAYAAVLTAVFGYMFEYMNTHGEATFEELYMVVAESADKFLTDNLILLTLISGVVTLLVYFIIFKARRKKFLAEVGIVKTKGIFYPLAFILGVSFNFFVSGLFSIIPIPEKLLSNYVETTADMGVANMAPVTVLLAVIVAPLLEEVVFRGLFYSRMRRCSPMLGAMILSAFIFGLMHGTALLWVIYAAVLGFILAWIYEKCGSLAPAILMHMGFNLVGAFSELIPNTDNSVMAITIVTAAAALCGLIMTIINRKSERKIEIGYPSALSSNENCDGEE